MVVCYIALQNCSTREFAFSGRLFFCALFAPMSSSIEVICPLVSLMTTNLDDGGGDHPIHSLSELALETSSANIVSFIRDAPDTTTAAATTSTHKRSRKASVEDSGPLSIRQAYQEMRNMESSLAADSVLSDGRRVGDFLVQQWLQKEARK